jgi:hypothetical protein
LEAVGSRETLSNVNIGFNPGATTEFQIKFKNALIRNSVAQLKEMERNINDLTIELANMDGKKYKYETLLGNVDRGKENVLNKMKLKDTSKSRVKKKSALRKVQEDKVEVRLRLSELIDSVVNCKIIICMERKHVWKETKCRGWCLCDRCELQAKFSAITSCKECNLWLCETCVKELVGRKVESKKEIENLRNKIVINSTRWRYMGGKIKEGSNYKCYTADCRERRRLADPVVQDLVLMGFQMTDVLLAMRSVDYLPDNLREKVCGDLMMANEAISNFADMGFPKADIEAAMKTALNSPELARKYLEEGKITKNALTATRENLRNLQDYFFRVDIRRAMYAANNNLEQAVKYLLTADIKHSPNLQLAAKYLLTAIPSNTGRGAVFDCLRKHTLEQNLRKGFSFCADCNLKIQFTKMLTCRRCSLNVCFSCVERYEVIKRTIRTWGNTSKTRTEVITVSSIFTGDRLFFR